MFNHNPDHYVFLILKPGATPPPPPEEHRWIDNNNNTFIDNNANGIVFNSDVGD